MVFNSVADKPNPLDPLPNVIAVEGVLLVKLTAPLPALIVPLASTISFAVKLIAVDPLLLVSDPLLVKVPVPPFTVIPPGPVMVALFVTPPPIKLTLPLLPLVIE